MVTLDFVGFLVENQIATILQQDEALRKMRKIVAQELSEHIPNQRYRDLVINYFTYLFRDAGYYHIQYDVAAAWRYFGDVVIAKMNNEEFRRNLNDPEFTRDKLELANAEYHRDMANKAKKLGKGGEGDPVVHIANILTQYVDDEFDQQIPPAMRANYSAAAWTGWNWVSLGRSYCGEEAAAGGHCGNTAYRQGDNIFSLRDRQNRVHLTFVINKGELGEAKALGNDKPSPMYHPAIFALLMSGYVKKVGSGRFATYNDFKLDDLKYGNNYVYDKAVAHLSGVDNHKIPDNFYTKAKIDTIKQEDVDRMTLAQKVGLAIGFVNNSRPEQWNIYEPYGFDTERLFEDIVDDPTIKVTSLYSVYRQMVDKAGRDEDAVDQVVLDYATSFARAIGNRIEAVNSKVFVINFLDAATMHAGIVKSGGERNSLRNDIMNGVRKLLKMGGMEKDINSDRDVIRGAICEYLTKNAGDFTVNELGDKYLRGYINITPTTYSTLYYALHHMVLKNNALTNIETCLMAYEFDSHKPMDKLYTCAAEASEGFFDEDLCKELLHQIERFNQEIHGQYKTDGTHKGIRRSMVRELSLVLNHAISAMKNRIMKSFEKFMAGYHFNGVGDFEVKNNKKQYWQLDLSVQEGDNMLDTVRQFRRDLFDSSPFKDLVKRYWFPDLRMHFKTFLNIHNLGVS